LQIARLTPVKTLSGSDFSFQPSLERSRVMVLAALDFIDRHAVVHFIGQSGTGKYGPEPSRACTRRCSSIKHENLRLACAPPQETSLSRQEQLLGNWYFMALSDLTDLTAINAAMEEFDRLGRDNFLKRYGFGPSRAYFLRHDGKDYDSKAIVGAAYGYQYPQEGPLHSSDFSGGEGTVQALLEGLGFIVEVRNSDGFPAISGTDIELIRASRSRDRYADLSPEEQAAHRRVHEALRQLGEVTVAELGGARDYVLKLTSGFHPNSGVRGGKPKDLWFGVYRKENESKLLVSAQPRHKRPLADVLRGLEKIN
jgi:IstB-like ATP binding protein